MEQAFPISTTSGKIDAVISMERRKMQNSGLENAVLLAAGRGVRLQPLTLSVPKCLLKVGGRPLLDHWLEKCEEAKIKRVFINMFYLAEQVREFLEHARSRYSFEIVPVHEENLTGTGGFLRKIRSRLLNGGDFFMCHADNFTDIKLTDFIQFHRKRHSPLSVALFRASNPTSCGIVEKIQDDGLIVEFREKPQNPKTNLASGAMFLISPEILHTLPDKEVIDFSKEILPQYQNRMFGYEIPGFNFDIGTPESFEAANKTAKGVAP